MYSMHIVKTINKYVLSKKAIKQFILIGSYLDSRSIQVNLNI